MLYFVLTLNREKKLMEWSLSVLCGSRLNIPEIITALRVLARIVIRRLIVILPDPCYTGFCLCSDFHTTGYIPCHLQNRS
jgi:hypothetical protein